MKKYYQESIFWFICAMPLVYLAVVWNDLPNQVPTHFDFSGQPNDWSDKSVLAIIVGLLTVGIYVMMLLLPRFDPKNKLVQMGSKFRSLRLTITLFLSVLAAYIVYSAHTANINPRILLGIIGLLYATLGNYLQTVQPNYFLGIKTPWTLESEEVWRKTHRLSGRIWLIAGGLIALTALICHNLTALTVVFIGATALIAIVPFVYSYIIFKRLK